MFNIRSEPWCRKTNGNFPNSLDANVIKIRCFTDNERKYDEDQRNRKVLDISIFWVEEVRGLVPEKQNQ